MALSPQCLLSPTAPLSPLVLCPFRPSPTLPSPPCLLTLPSHFVLSPPLLSSVRAAGGKDKPYVCKGIYICVSQGSMQAIDFKWLSRQGFRFHHYRKAGHGTFPDHPSSPALDRSGSAHGSTKPADEEHDNAEFVYYCWPGKPEHDRVPSYATSIEGATGMALSKDETRVRACAAAARALSQCFPSRTLCSFLLLTTSLASPLATS